MVAYMLHSSPRSGHLKDRRPIASIVFKLKYRVQQSNGYVAHEKTLISLDETGN